MQTLGSTCTGNLKVLTNHSLGFATNDVERARITAAGIACFACQVCSPAFVGGTVCGTTGTFSTTYNGGGIGMLHLTSGGTEGGSITFEKTSCTVQKYKLGNSGTSLFIYNETGTSQPFTKLNNGNIGINTTNPLAGLQIEKYGSKFDSDSQYNQPSGNVFFSAAGAVANQDNWIGIRGSYNSTSGTSNLLLQANYRDVNSQAGHYLSSKATNFGVADFIIGKLVTSTSVSTPPTLVPQLTIASTGVACFACELTAKTLGTNDLILNNLNYECANYVDGTRGSWLIQEGACDLFIINQVSCKKYKFNLIEIK
jgi:hypothetical protein